MSKRKLIETEVEEDENKEISEEKEDEIEEISEEEESENIFDTEVSKKRKRRQKLVIEKETQMDNFKIFIIAMLMFISLVMSLLIALLLDIAGITYLLNFIASMIFFIIGIFLAVILINVVIFGKPKRR